MSLIKVSAAKREANQRNAQHSTGPKTPEGRQRSSRNATTHGCTATRLDHPLRHESPDHHANTLSDLIESWQPANAMEAMLVKAIAEAWIRMERSARWEATVLDNVAETRMRVVSELLRKKGREVKEEIDGDLGAVIAMADEDGSVMWQNVQRHSAKAWRDWHKAVETLRKLQNKRTAEAKTHSESADMGSNCISEAQQTATAQTAAAAAVSSAMSPTPTPQPPAHAPDQYRATPAVAAPKQAPAAATTRPHHVVPSQPELLENTHIPETFPALPHIRS